MCIAGEGVALPGLRLLWAGVPSVLWLCCLVTTACHDPTVTRGCAIAPCTPIVNLAIDLATNHVALSLHLEGRALSAVDGVDDDCPCSVLLASPTIFEQSSSTHSDTSQISHESTEALTLLALWTQKNVTPFTLLAVLFTLAFIFYFRWLAQVLFFYFR